MLRVQTGLLSVLGVAVRAGVIAAALMAGAPGVARAQCVTGVSIATQPIAQVICDGSTLTLTVAATGSPAPTYRWQSQLPTQGFLNMSDGVNVSGALTNSVTISNFSPASFVNYRCRVTNACGTVDTVTVRCEVDTAVAITTSPASQTICEGGTLAFSVVATGTNLQYEWRNGNNAVITDGVRANGTVVSGATTSTLTYTNALDADVPTNSRAWVSNSCGTVSSVAAIATFHTPVSITTGPIAQTVCAGGTASLSVSAAGSGTLGYVWRNGNLAIITNGTKAGGTVVSGATTSTITFSNINASDLSAFYHADVTGPCGTESSGAAGITVNPVTAISTQPTSQTVCAGGSASLSVVAAGTNLTYRWRNGNLALITDGVKPNGTVVSGAQTSTITFSNLNAADLAAFYHADVTGDCGTASSSSASIALTPVTTVVASPSAMTLCSGGTASLSVVAAGSNRTYRWRNGNLAIINDGVKANGTIVSGAQTATITFSNINAADLSALYHCDVTGDCGSDSSASAAISVLPTTVITTNPVTQRPCQGATASLSVVASGSNLTYRWRNGNLALTNDGVKAHGTIVSGAQTATITFSNINAADLSANYHCDVTGDCGSDSSSAAGMRVCKPDFNCSGSVEVSDIFAFLTAWFQSSPSADYNADGSINVQDIFDFLSGWFAGCA